MKIKFIILGLSLILFIHTINAQQGWFWQNPLPQGNTLNSIYFKDDQTGWAVGRSGAIIKTTDGGENWYPQGSGTSDYLNSVYFTDDQTGWIVGNWGTILKTLDGGGVVSVDENKKLIKNYLLSQNYPNPFNPSTKIQYSVNSAQNVTLKVFDLLGREIATLVNEEKPTGEYEVEFSAKGGSASGGNAYDLTNGIYFYRLRAGKYVETKKMVLIK